MSDEMTITVDSEEYVLRPEGGSVKVGRRVGGDPDYLRWVVRETREPQRGTGA